MPANWIQALAAVAAAGAAWSAPMATADTAPAVPAWAFPGNASPAVPAQPLDEHEALHVPGSRVTFTRGQIADLFSTPDWYPDSHPPMPDIVAHGRKPAVPACGYCHLPDGQGRPENAPLAGLPAAYIVAQVADMRSGARRSAWQGPHAPNDLMHALAKDATSAEVAAAAEYFSKLPLTRRTEVIETSAVPITRESRWVHLVAEGAGTEPLGERIIEVPVDPGRHELRDAAAPYRAFVPAGSIARGKLLVESGNGDAAVACATCHGPDLRGVGLVPPLAGRSPSYLVRQLLAFRTGARASPAGQPMAAVATKLDERDMIAAAAYAAAANPAKPQQYLYVLRLVPRLHDDNAWTAADNAAVSRHFQHLKAATAAGRVILAGRTTESGDKTMGLVIFEAADDAEARRFMESDPSVIAGVMTATLHPYAVALQRAPRN